MTTGTGSLIQILDGQFFVFFRHDRFLLLFCFSGCSAHPIVYTNKMTVFVTWVNLFSDC